MPGDTAIRTLLSQTLETGGSTVSLIGAPIPTSGYMVGGVVDSLIFGKDLLGHGDVAMRMIDKYIGSHLLYASRPDMFLGAWIDNDSGMVYVDFSAHYDVLAYALDDARENEELAIWDLEKSEEIRVS